MATAPPFSGDPTELLVVEEIEHLLEVGIQGPPGPPGPIGPSGVVSLQLTALGAIGGHRVVVSNAMDQASYADVDVAAHAGRVAGITMNAAVDGDSVLVINNGRVVEPSWSWVPDIPVFLSHNGLLTQSPSGGVFQQVLGVALDPTTLFVNLREPIVLAL